MGVSRLAATRSLRSGARGCARRVFARLFIAASVWRARTSLLSALARGSRLDGEWLWAGDPATTVGRSLALRSEDCASRLNGLRCAVAGVVVYMRKKQGAGEGHPPLE